uniref:Uncharacterized protein n=1 Tax=Avena sativa TaxID=4498 RepID=A0ACD5YTF3_AVESA
MATAAAGYSWADLNSELLVSIATETDNGLSLGDYASLRGVCTAWRSALAPPGPCLLSISDGRASVFSLPTRRSFHLCEAAAAHLMLLDEETRDMGITSHAHVVGSGNGRFAIAIDHRMPDHATIIRDGLLRFPGKRRSILSHASCWTERLFLLNPHTGEEVQLLPPGRHGYDRVSKIVFTPDPGEGTVEAMYGTNKVAYIDTASRRDAMKWTTIDVASRFTKNLVDLVFDNTRGGKLYCLESRGGVLVLQIPRGGVRNEQAEPGPVVVESSLTLQSFPSTAFNTHPYNIASAKNLFFCHGSLYQVWQNTSATVRSGDGSTMSADEIFLLRYNPAGCSPYCWDVANDLGGFSVFLGKHNSPAVVRASAVPGVQADCVYWIDWRGVPMVCDVAAGTSKPCLFPYGACKRNCWYFAANNIQPSTATGQTNRRAIYASEDCSGPTRSVRPQRRRLVLDLLSRPPIGSVCGLVSTLWRRVSLWTMDAIVWRKSLRI